MAQRTATLYYQDVINIALRSVARSIENDFAAFVANSATYFIWNRYDWRETLAQLPPFWLIPSEQDHGAPAVIIPSDYYGLRKVWMQRALTMPPLRQNLEIIKDLSLTHIRYLPHAIGYNQATQAFRVYPRVPDNIGAPDFMIAGEYKIKPPKVLANELASTLLPFDDVYQDVWVAVLKWAAMNAAGDPRAGQVTMGPDGGHAATGQLAAAFAAIDEMARVEGLEGGDQNISPTEPLAITGYGLPGVLGLGFFN